MIKVAIELDLAACRPRPTQFLSMGGSRRDRAFTSDLAAEIRIAPTELEADVAPQVALSRSREDLLVAGLNVGPLVSMCLSRTASYVRNISS